MKRIVEKILFFCLLLTAGCNKVPEYYSPEKAPDGQIEMIASVNELVLERQNALETAVTFTWNEAASRGNSTELTYYFRIYNADTSDMLQSKVIEIEPDVWSMNWSTFQLNNLLHSWGISPGDRVSVRAEIIAQVTTSSKFMFPEISSVDLKVTGYDPTNRIYLVMNSENSTEKIIEMQEIEAGTAIFTWKGELTPCNYYFIADRGKKFPAYMKGEDRNTLAVITSEGEYEKFVIEESGIYTIIMNQKLLTTDLNVDMYPLSENGLWIIGDGSDAGWIYGNIGKDEFKFKQDDVYPQIWTYTGNFYAGTGNTRLSFKVLLSPKGWNPCFFAPHDWTDPRAEHEIAIEPGGDYKWQVFESGKYTVTVNISTMKIYFEKSSE